MAVPLTANTSNGSLNSLNDIARFRTSSMESELAQSDLPVNFGEVAKGIYRSAFPNPWNLAALKRLGLKTIITLVDEPFTPNHVSFMKENGIIHHRIVVQANKDPDIKVPDSVMCRILELLTDESNHPVLVHCNKGKHRTGCVVACFRKLQGWSTPEAIDEYLRYSNPKPRMLDQLFISGFDTSQVTRLPPVSAVRTWQPLKISSEMNSRDKISTTLHIPL
ncbi:hypothetical protein BO70DRAFT_223142 [Aspergillus heteromorphus CBS 117.55]|uniref:diphosphoinositol-polyphosphate diphosphatase n=1 Tax=Aspergillus heteromorphus CBS 117.55 TaxID=1448321 RepID=A0A317WLL2_9EURO|nr:uncharacterized protein BO70DRAFT_223142 [Aspergillus heteromorphus CBS 117.55]PWY86212.1 hypothetical protein BO70DRAFT_223142 [Aspergillus heteromorphus CBS 117.55]